MKWFKGKTLLDCLDSVVAPKRPVNKPLRIPIQDVYKIQGIGTVPVGRVETGILENNMQLYFSPNDVISECKSIEMHHQQLKQAGPGANIGFNVKNVNKNQIKRGNVCGDINDNPPLQVIDFQAQVIIINHNNIHNGYTPVIDCHTAHIACRFNQILSKVDRRTGQKLVDQKDDQ